MGGNALTNVETRRINKEEYTRLRDNIISSLNNYFTSTDVKPGRSIRDIPCYRTKSDFGDLDLLFETFPGESHNYKKIITELFNPTQIVVNGNCYSFDVNNFQVDLILTPTENYQTSVDYFSFNDLGNLVGKISKKLGFKYGHDGLTYLFRTDDKTFSVYAETVVSKDTEQIHKFFDLDHDQFINGFDTLEEIFVWVSNSKYFHKDIYLLMNRNYTSRVRDKKRKVYNMFLKWCQDTPNLNAYPWLEMREQDGYAGKPEFLKLAFTAFPNFAIEHKRIVTKHEQDKMIHTKFNGNIVRNITGFNGEQLGKLMQHILNNNGGKENVYSIVLPMSEMEVEQFILKNTNTFK